MADGANWRCLAEYTDRTCNIACPPYNAKLDAVTVSDGAMTATDNTLTSAAGMTGIAAGMSIEVEGAGTGGTLLVTTVTRVTNENRVKLADAAASAVRNAHVGYGTNNATALHDAAVAANPGGTVLIPQGTGYIQSQWAGSPALLSGLDGVTFRGTGHGAVLKWLHPADGGNGFVIRLEFASNLTFTNFAIDLNNARRANKSAFGIACIDGCVAVDVHGMHFFDSRATASTIGKDKDRWAVVFGAPIRAHRNINIYNNLVEDELQFECHLVCQQVRIANNFMVNEVSAPKTTSAIWIGTEVNRDGDIQDVEISGNIIKGYSHRAVTIIHNGVDFSSAIRRAKVHDNIIVAGRAGTGQTGIFVGVGNSSLTYNAPIAFEDIEVYNNQIFVPTTVTNDFAGIRFNNGAKTGFRFQRPVIRGNALSRTAYLDSGSNDGINVQRADHAEITDNRVIGFRFGYRIGLVENSVVARNYHLGVTDTKEAVDAFNAMLISAFGDGNVVVADNRFEGQYDDAVVWLLSPLEDSHFIRNRIDASAANAVKIDNVLATGLQLVDTYINGTIATGITRNGVASGGRAQVRGTQFGATLPRTFFQPGTTHRSDVWLLAERTQVAEITDTGDSSPGTLTLVPYYKFLNITTSDTNGGNELTISEAQAAEGMEIDILHLGTQTLTVKHVAGQFITLTGRDTTVPAKTLIRARYLGGAWYQTQ